MNDRDQHSKPKSSKAKSSSSSYGLAEGDKPTVLDQVSSWKKKLKYFYIGAFGLLLASLIVGYLVRPKKNVEIPKPGVVAEKREVLEVGREAILERDVAKVRQLLRNSPKWPSVKSQLPLVAMEHQQLRVQLADLLLELSDNKQDQLIALNQKAEGIWYEHVILSTRSMSTEESSAALNSYVDSYESDPRDAVAASAIWLKIRYLVNHPEAKNSDQIEKQIIPLIQKSLERFPRSPVFRQRIYEILIFSVEKELPFSDELVRVTREYHLGNGDKSDLVYVSLIDDGILLNELNYTELMRDRKLYKKEYLEALKSFVGQHHSSRVAMATLNEFIDWLEKQQLQDELVEVKKLIDSRELGREANSFDKLIAKAAKDSSSRYDQMGQTIDLVGLQCEQVELNQEMLDGKIVVVCFWNGKVVPSRAMMAQISKLRKGLENRNVLFININTAKGAAYEPSREKDSQWWRSSLGLKKDKSFHPVVTSFPRTKATHLLVLDEQGMLANCNASVELLFKQIEELRKKPFSSEERSSEKESAEKETQAIGD